MTLGITLVAVRAIVALYLAVLALFLILRVITGDRFWPIALLNNIAPYVVLPLLIVTLISPLVGSLPLTLTSLILMIVCAAWFIPYFLPKQRRIPEHPTLRIITFNIWGGNPMQHELTEWLRSQNADIVFLQEVPTSYEQTYFETLSSLYPNSYRQHSPHQWWTNAVLSKYPICSVVDLDSYTRTPSTRQRIVIELADRQIALYSIHLSFMPRKARIQTKKWTLFGAMSNFDDSCRNTQIDSLLSELASEPLPFIVAGDFNTSAFSITYHKIASCLHDSFAEVGYGLGGTWPSGEVLHLPNVVPPLLRIDYVWHSDHFRAITARVGPYMGSDHCPVIAQLELVPEEA